MKQKILFIIILLIKNFVFISYAQVFGSNLLTALRGYSSDMCRFVSCSFGQYCINGACILTSDSSLLGQTNGLNGGLLGASSKLCAETVDCYSGQICQGGRCIFSNSLYGNIKPSINNAALNALNPAIGNYYSSSILPYGSYNRLNTLIDRPSGIDICNIMQDCLNGQICVNGYCSQSNVVYGGSQAFKALTTCATGAICPVGQYCMGGVCIQNPFSQTSACGLGTICPNGMSCQFGRCLTAAIFYGKR